MTTTAAPRRFLFAMFQGGGNIPLLLPIIARLVQRGHEVRVLAGPGIRPGSLPISERFSNGVKAAGATLLTFEGPPVDPYTSAPPLPGLVAGWTPRRLRSMALRELRVTIWSGAWAKNVTRVLREDPPDVLVCDFLLLGAIAAGEVFGIPTACIVHNAFPPGAHGQPPKGLGFARPTTPLSKLKDLYWCWARQRLWQREGLRFHNEARAELGLPPLRAPLQQYDSLDRMLILGHREFDFPADNLPPYVRYVGTPIDDAATEAWTSPWPEDDRRPLLLVSLSTLAQGQEPVMKRLVEAVGQLPVRALVTLGPSLRRDDYSPAPNTVLETFIPHSSVLPHVDAMVTQCGLGSFTKALRHGVPLVCLPLVGDQPDNAARIVASGAGIRLSSSATVDQIRSAVTQVLERPTYREAAAALASQMTATDAEDNAARELESISLRRVRTI